MPITPISKPLFPDVPNVLGVPALRRQFTTRQTTRLIVSRILSRVLLSRFTKTGVWGLYDKDGKIIEVNSVFSLDFKGTSKISEVPLQNGSFAAYNKVQLPDFEFRTNKSEKIPEMRDLVFRSRDGKEVLSL